MEHVPTSILKACALLLLGCWTGCIFNEHGISVTTNTNGNANTNSNSNSNGNTNTSAECGDGLVHPSEACDDENTTDGDGCSHLCAIEPGWSCQGEPSVCTGGCGDGVVQSPEACDDGNEVGDDGCAGCLIEVGWLCDGSPSECLPICGDGLVRGDEQCDDNNTAGDDGCTDTCVLEPSWSCQGEPSVCAAWANTRWGFRKRITIHHEWVAENLQSFPVLIHLTADTDLSSAALPDGHDILFTKADGTTRQSHEIQRYASATGELIAWVKVNALSAAEDTALYLYYGEPLATDQQQIADVWSNGYEAVLHLREAGNGTTDEFADSTGNGHHGTGGGTPNSGSASRTPVRVSGWVGHAQEFDGGDDHIRLRNVEDGIWGALTVQIWMKPADHEDDTVFAKAWSTGAPAEVWSLGKNADTRVYLQTDGGFSTYNGGDTWVTSTWYHYAFTWDRNDGHAVRTYQNGVRKVDDVRSGNDLQNNGTLPSIGNVGSAALNEGFTGMLQEARLSRVARSEGWLWTEHRNVSDPATFYTVHPVETVP